MVQSSSASTAVPPTELVIHFDEYETIHPRGSTLQTSGAARQTHSATYLPPPHDGTMRTDHCADVAQLHPRCDGESFSWLSAAAHEWSQCAWRCRLHQQQPSHLGAAVAGGLTQVLRLLQGDAAGRLLTDALDCTQPWTTLPQVDALSMPQKSDSQRRQLTNETTLVVVQQMLRPLDASISDVRQQRSSSFAASPHPLHLQQLADQVAWPRLRFLWETRTTTTQQMTPR
jgi:hypothetical protein